MQGLVSLAEIIVLIADIFLSATTLPEVIREYFYAILQHDPGQELKGETETCLKHKEAVDAEEGNTVRGQMAKSESTCPESRVQQQKCDHEETPWTEKGSTLPEELSKIEPIQPGVIKNDYALLEKYGKKSKRSREGPLANAHEKEQTKQVLDERLFASQQPFKKEHIFPENTLASGDSSQIKSQMGVQFLASKDHKQLYHTHLVNKKVSGEDHKRNDIEEKPEVTCSRARQNIRIPARRKYYTEEDFDGIDSIPYESSSEEEGASETTTAKLETPQPQFDVDSQDSYDYHGNEGSSWFRRFFKMSRRPQRFKRYVNEYNKRKALEQASAERNQQPSVDSDTEEDCTCSTCLYLCFKNL